MNPFSLNNKTIIITGASSGIGRQCAISCSKMGASVVLVARNEDRLKSTLSEMKAGNHLYYSLDVTSYDEIESVIQDVVLKIGKISGFIHSAGIELTLPLKMLKPIKFQEVFAVNVVSAFTISRILSKKKFIDDAASFVFISSIMAQLGQPGKIGYCSSKGALVAGARAMALEFAKRKIRVNSVLPGMIKTKMSLDLLDSLSKDSRLSIESMHPLNIGNTEDVANACIYLLSDASKWVTGTNLIVDGGYSAR